jgi:hypothetical protein
MITEYPLEDRRYDQPEYEKFWAASAHGMPLSLHTATRRQGRIRGADDKTSRDASSRPTKAFYPALSLCDSIFFGVSERHPRLRVAIVEFEMPGRRTCSRRWTTPTASATARRSTGSRACPREGGGRHAAGRLLPPQPRIGARGRFRLELPGGRHRHPPALALTLPRLRGREGWGSDNMMWGSDYPHSESTFPQSRKILAEILADVPDDEQTKIASGNTARVYNFDAVRLAVPG